MSDKSSSCTSLERCPTQRVVLQTVMWPSRIVGSPFFFLSSSLSLFLASSSFALFFSSSLSFSLSRSLPRPWSLLLLLFLLLSLSLLRLRLLVLLLFPFFPRLSDLLRDLLPLPISLLPEDRPLLSTSSIIMTSSSVSPACSPSSRGDCRGIPKPWLRRLLKFSWPIASRASRPIVWPNWF